MKKTKKLIFSFIIIFMAFFGLGSAIELRTVHAAGTPIESGLWTDFISIADAPAGEGTQISPFKISTAQQLAYIADKVNSGQSYSGAYFILANNLDLSSHYWIPIGTVSNPFDAAAFDFGGKTISGLTVRNLQGGLFGVIAHEFNISNLILEDVHVINSTGSSTGGLVADAGSKTTINNVTVSGFVSGTSAVGAFSGSGRVEILNSINNANVKGENNVGGFVGTSPASVSNCRNYGEISGQTGVGGIVGYTEGGTFDNTLNFGKISGTTSSGGIAGIANNVVLTSVSNYGDVSGGSGTGGIAGNGQIHQITRANNYGKVSGNNSVGGVIGSGFGNAGYCSNQGEVIGTGNGIGGLAGISTGPVNNCYNTGKIIGGSYVGGLIGMSSGHGISNSLNTGDVSGAINVGGIVGNVWISEGTAAINDVYNCGSISADESPAGAMIGLLDYSGTSRDPYGFSMTNAISSGIGNTYTAGLIGSINISYGLLDTSVRVRLDMIDCHFIGYGAAAALGGLASHIAEYEFLTINFVSTAINGNTASYLAVKSNFKYFNFSANGFWEIDESGVNAINGGIPYLKLQMLEVTFENSRNNTVLSRSVFMGSELNFDEIEADTTLSVTAGYTFLGFTDSSETVYKNETITVNENKNFATLHEATKYLIVFNQVVGTPMPTLRDTQNKLVNPYLISLEMSDLVLHTTIADFTDYIWQVWIPGTDISSDSNWRDVGSLKHLPAENLLTEQFLLNYVRPISFEDSAGVYGARGEITLRTALKPAAQQTKFVSVRAASEGNGQLYLGIQLLHTGNSAQVQRNTSAVLNARPIMFYEINTATATISYNNTVYQISPDSFVSNQYIISSAITAVADEIEIFIEFKKIDFQIDLICRDQNNTALVLDNFINFDSDQTFSVAEICPVQASVVPGLTSFRFNGWVLYNYKTQSYEVFSLSEVLPVLNFSEAQLSSYIRATDTSLKIFAWFIEQQMLQVTCADAQIGISATVVTSEGSMTLLKENLNLGTPIDMGSHVVIHVTPTISNSMDVSEMSEAYPSVLFSNNEISFIADGLSVFEILLKSRTFAIVLGAEDASGNRVPLRDTVTGLFPIVYKVGASDTPGVISKDQTISDILFCEGGDHANYRLLYFAVKKANGQLSSIGKTVAVTDAFLAAEMLNQFGEINLVAVVVRIYSVTVSLPESSANLGSYEIYINDETKPSNLVSFPINSLVTIRLIPKNLHYELGTLVGIVNGDTRNGNDLSFYIHENRVFNASFRPVKYKIESSVTIKGSGTVRFSSNTIAAGDILYITFETSGLFDIKGFFINDMNIMHDYEYFVVSNNTIALVVNEHWLNGHLNNLNIKVTTKMNDIALSSFLGAGIGLPILILFVVFVFAINRKQYNATKEMLYKKRETMIKRDTSSFVEGLRQGTIGNITKDDIKKEMKEKK